MLLSGSHVLVPFQLQLPLLYVSRITFHTNTLIDYNRLCAVRWYRLSCNWKCLPVKGNFSIKQEISSCGTEFCLLNFSPEHKISAMFHQSDMKWKQKCFDFWSHLKIATKVCYFCSKLCLCAKILSTLLAKIPTCLPLQVTFNCPKTTTSHPLSTLQLCLFKCKLAIYLWVGWYHNDYKTSLCSQLNLNWSSNLN